MDNPVSNFIDGRSKMTIVVPDPERFDGHCRPAQLIRRLHRQRRLPNFARAFGDWTADAGNCVSVSTALLMDLHHHGLAEDWEIVLGEWLLTDARVAPDGLHCWLEANGWSIDCSNGRIHVAPVADYVAHEGVKAYARMTAADLLAWVAAGHTQLPEPPGEALRVERADQGPS
jgi:hypothetical protein